MLIFDRANCGVRRGPLPRQFSFLLIQRVPQWSKQCSWYWCLSHQYLQSSSIRYLYNPLNVALGTASKNAKVSAFRLCSTLDILLLLSSSAILLSCLFPSLNNTFLWMPLSSDKSPYWSQYIQPPHPFVFVAFDIQLAALFISKFDSHLVSAPLSLYLVWRILLAF
jgi:hypothetical protein